MDNLMSLMAASPYIWQGGGTDSRLTWQDKFFGGFSILHAPRRRSAERFALGERLCDDGHAKRTQAYASLSWDGAKFQIDYKIRTFDGRNIWVEERGNA